MKLPNNSEGAVSIYYQHKHVWVYCKNIDGILFVECPDENGKLLEGHQHKTPEEAVKCYNSKKKIPAEERWL